ncbi:MAG: helix-hairpin-helix domain-containing protein [Candidatus Eremiobacteraeota bacterium]|nr:helix-hairpin-helix domain-containing protein [Candidatus Eremiobacteraeota bacterium]
MKRYLGAAVILAAVIALLFHPSRTQHAFVQSDVTPAPFATHSRHLRPVEIIVYVAGSVAKPGLYRLAAGSRGVDAIRAAGGLKAQADPAGVNLAEQLEDGEQITAPLVGERRLARTLRRRAKHRRHKRAPALSDGQSVAPVDLNRADVQMLTQLPGIGEELARRIVAFRATNGPFASLDELADVAGITPRLIASLTAYVTIGR